MRVIIETRMSFSWCNMLSVNSPEIRVLHVCKMDAGKNYAHHGANISNIIYGQAFAALLLDAVSTRKLQGRGTQKTPATRPGENCTYAMKTNRRSHEGCPWRLRKLQLMSERGA